MSASSRFPDSWLSAILDQPLPRPLDRPVRVAASRLAGRALWLAGRLEGLAYHLEGRHPDEIVDDATLAQRVRSTLGPVEHELDVPRVHLTVHDGEVLLHGRVGTLADVRALIRATERVVGVQRVTSHLHVGLEPGDVRPSEGRAAPMTSPAWKDLLGAARGVGLSEDGADRATRAVLATLFDCLPEDERAHVLTHLPADVRRNARPPLEVGRPARPRTVKAFERVVADRAQLPEGEAGLAARAVLDALRDLVPEEAEDVAAVLPKGLKPLWAPMAAAGGAGR